MLAAGAAQVNFGAEFETRREFTIFRIDLCIEASDAALKTAALH
jgi:hypothetical protein